MLISNLANDVLSQILSYLEITAVCRLHASSIPLQRMISGTSVVKRAYVEATRPKHLLPSLLYRLPGLLSVSLLSKNSVEALQLPAGITHPCQFGPSVKTLSISAPDATRFLPDCPVDCHPADDEDGHCGHFLSRHVPNLESFDLTFWSGVGSATMIIGGLPSTLTNLSMAHRGFPVEKDPYPSIDHLPNLVTIDIRDCFDSGDSGGFALVHCKHLTSAILPSLPFDVVLPNTIETAHLSTLNRFWSANLSNISTLSIIRVTLPIAIPPTLTSLTVDAITEMKELIAALPSTLTRLRFQMWRAGRVPCDLSLFSLLPFGLKSLQLDTRVRLLPFEQFKPALEARCAGGKLTWLPPHLDDFKVSTDIITRPYLALLPPSIRAIASSLSIECTPEEISSPDFSIDLASRLPLVRNLALMGSPSALLDLSARNLILPSYLTHLYMTYPSYDDDLNFKAPSYVPRRSYISVLDSPFLPKTLLYLTLEDHVMPTSLANLPAGLLSLRCRLARHSAGITYAKGPLPGHPQLTFVSEAFADSLKTLPRHLTTLSLTMRLLVPVSKELIQSLPRQLTTLNLKSLYKLEDKHIPLLPRTLYRLSVNHCENLSDACVSMLPPTLQQLLLRGNRALTPSSFKNFPSALMNLHIPKNRNFPKALYASFNDGSKTVRTRKLQLRIAKKRM